MEIFSKTRKNIRKTQLHFVFLNSSFVCQNISVCLKLNRPRLVIVYCDKTVFTELPQSSSVGTSYRIFLKDDLFVFD